MEKGDIFTYAVYLEPRPGRFITEIFATSAVGQLPITADYITY